MPLFKNIETSEFTILILIFVAILMLSINYIKIVSPTNNALIIKKSENMTRTNATNNLILYYTNWCGFSQQFLPTWFNLEKYIKENKININIQSIDCDKNKCPNIKGYPTILLHKQDKTIINYDGDRSMQNLISFIQTNNS